jgi:hypothetical protein
VNYQEKCAARVQAYKDKCEARVEKYKNWSKVISLPASLRPRIEALAKADHRTTKSWLEKIILEVVKK